jgi:hypothetical protein
MVELYCIGGSPCSGKSTIAEMLVNRCGFQYFKQDDHLNEYMEKGSQEGHDLFKKVSTLSTEEMWMRDPFEQYCEEVALYKIMFSYSMNDISVLPQGTAIIAEGAGFMPSMAKKMKIGKANYICMVPTKEFQVKTYSQREWISQYLSGCSEKEKAFANWMERDALFAKNIQQEAEGLGYESLIVDGSKGIEDIFTIIMHVFKLGN